MFEIVEAFQHTLPFENLDALAGAPLSTNLSNIVEKIVFNGRGGWCYELNQLLGETLKIAGFNVTHRMARVGFRRPGLGPVTHLVLIVNINNCEWLVDAGFGGPGPIEPLPLLDGEHTTKSGPRFLIEEREDGSIFLHRKIADKFEMLYQIQQMDILPIDIEVASHFVATWPHSPFRRMLFCVINNGSTSWAIDGTTLVQLDANWTPIEKRQIKDADHLHQLLSEVFKIQVPRDLSQKSWLEVTNSPAH